MLIAQNNALSYGNPYDCSSIEKTDVVIWFLHQHVKLFKYGYFTAKQQVNHMLYTFIFAFAEIFQNGEQKSVDGTKASNLNQFWAYILLRKL